MWQDQGSHPRSLVLGHRAAPWDWCMDPCVMPSAHQPSSLRFSRLSHQHFPKTQSFGQQAEVSRDYDSYKKGRAVCLLGLGGRAQGWGQRARAVSQTALNTGTDVTTDWHGAAQGSSDKNPA